MILRRIAGQRGGFTLIELMVTMVIFVIAMAAAANIFSGLLTQFKQQSRIAESNIESIVGLELLRRDLQQAGNGIPWNLDGVNYSEVSGAGSAYNDDNGGANSNPPRALVIGDGAGWTSPGQGAGSDEIAIKATSVATNEASQKWTFIAKRQPGPNLLRTWGAIARENLDKDKDFVIIMNPGSGNLQRTLANKNGAFSVKLNDANFSFNKTPPATSTTFAFEPFTDTQGAYVVYGIKSGDDADPPRMPFNRADYYISAANVPSRCATSELAEANRRTGVLLKSVIDNSNISLKAGQRLAGLPILDCVADMQVVALADVNIPQDGIIDTAWDSVPATSGQAAQDIRNQMKEVRVYILAHEGQKDPTFQFTNFTGSPAAPFNNVCPGNCATCIHVGEPTGIAGCTGRMFDLSKIPDYLNYRWKVYTFAVSTNNLR